MNAAAPDYVLTRLFQSPENDWYTELMRGLPTHELIDAIRTNLRGRIDNPDSSNIARAKILTELTNRGIDTSTLYDEADANLDWYPNENEGGRRKRRRRSQIRKKRKVRRRQSRRRVR